MGIIWSKKKDSWHKCFQKCKEYLDTHEGDTIPNDLLSYDGINIRTWIDNNITLYKLGQMPNDRLKLLESIHWLDMTTYYHENTDENADVFKSKSGQIWLANYKKCKEYIENSGSFIMPIHMQTVESTKMSSWLYLNRQRYRKNSLSQEKMKLLKGIHILEIKFRNPEIKKYSEENLRTRSLHIKISEDEYAVLKELTDQSDFDTISDYVRSVLLRQQSL